MLSMHTINTSVNVPIYTYEEDIKAATEEDAELQMLKRYIIGGWLDLTKAVEPGSENIG